VLVVDPGRIVEDYQTVAHAIRASRARRVDVTPEAVIRYWTGREIARQELPSAGDNDGGVKATEITRRTYLADAMFVAALEGDRELLESVRLRLRDPVFPLSLGRAACLPAAPVAMGEREDGGLVPLDAEGALRSLIPEAHEWCSLRHPARAERERRAQGMRIIIECDPAEATIRVQDQPSAYAFSTRTFGTRYSRAVGIGATDA
jgi:hypothetical protein